MIRFPAESPLEAELTPLVHDLVEAQVAVLEEMSAQGYLLFLDEHWDELPLGSQVVDDSGPLDAWLPTHRSDNASLWDTAGVVVYVEEMANELSFHFVADRGGAVHALVVDLHENEARWIDPVGPTSTLLIQALCQKGSGS